MTTNLYVVYDEKAQESGPIFQSKNHDVAVRQYWNLMKDISVSSDEFTLFFIGTYDSEEMLLLSHEKVEHVITEVRQGDLADARAESIQKSIGS